MKAEAQSALPALLAVWGGALAVYLAPQSLSWGRLLTAWLWLAALCLATLAMRRPLNEKNGLLWTGGAWTAWGLMTVLLLRQGSWTAAVWWLAALNLALALLWGLGRQPALAELGLGVWGGFAAPAWMYFLARGDWHPWLLLLGMPLALTLIAAQLAWGFSAFAADERRGRRTLVRWLGWPTAGWLHQALLASAFALLLLDAILLRLPQRLLWPLFLAAPLAVYQALHLRNILAGMKPVWPLVRAAGLSIPLLLGYLLTVSLLLH